MSRISFLIAFSLLNLILCAENLKEAQDIGIPGIAYDETDLKLKQYLQGGNMLSAFKSFITKVFAEGITKGIATGRAEGYEMADSKNFLTYFQCAVSNSKVDLEVYKAGVSKGLYQRKPEPLSPTTSDGKWIPSDIEDYMIKYDAWMPYYDALSIPNGDTIANPPTSFLPDPLKQLLMDITKTSKNWYLIVTYPFEDLRPSYVTNLQKYLKAVQQHNPNKYKTEEEIYQRFAVHMARSYKMMCVLHHKVLSFMDKLSTQPFPDLLFKCVPSFYIPDEQLFFLNALRSARNPNSNPLQHYAIKNKCVNNEQWTIVPFDNSTRCPYVDVRKLSTTLISTWTPITSPVTQTN